MSLWGLALCATLLLCLQTPWWLALSVCVLVMGCKDHREQTLLADLRSFGFDGEFYAVFGAPGRRALRLRSVPLVLSSGLILDFGLTDSRWLGLPLVVSSRSVSPEALHELRCFFKRPSMRASQGAGI